MKYKHLNIEETGKRIKKEMDKKGISQKELAELLGISIQSVNKYVNGINLPSLNNLLTISHIFGKSIDDILVIK